MMHKIRSVMGKRDGRYQLEESLEIDDAFFKTVSQVETDPITGNKMAQKCGRGSQQQSTVLVMIESKPVEKPKKHKKSKKCGHLKMIVMDDLKSKSINQQVSEKVNPDSQVTTDGYGSYSKLKEVISIHRAEIVPPTEVNKILPWVHTAISNAKRNLLGIHHMIGRVYLQNYLNEYCYKLNRRYFGSNIFERLMVASVSDTWYDKKSTMVSTHG
jgi:transposase-like protein